MGRQKRGRGDGSIYQRADTGIWCASVVLPDGTRKTLYGRSRDVVADKLKDAHTAVRSGQPIPSRKETLAAFAERWQRDVLAQRVRAATFDRYSRDLRLHIVPALGKLKLPDITPQKVQPFLNALSAEGLGPRGVAHCRAVLRVLLQHAMREGLIGQNAAKLVTIPRQVKKKVEALAPADARALLAAFRGHDFEALITVALATGLRQGELLGLGWDDVDLDRGTVRVQRQLQRIGGAYQLVELKTEQSRRTLALPAVAVETLRAHRARQNAARLLYGPLWRDSGRIFTTAEGDYLNGSAVTHRFQDHLKVKGLLVRPFHELRHGAASLLLAQGANMRTVMEQLGHSQISLTMNTYSHISPAVLRDAADRLNDALSGS